jgi:hypothetical protein
MRDPESPCCFAPLPEGKRYTCVPLSGQAHFDLARCLYYNDRGRARLVRLQKGASLPKSAPL